MKKPNSFWNHVLQCVGHLAAGAVIFASIFTFGWIIGLIVHLLHSFHPFSNDAHSLIGKIEVGLLYLDVAVGLVVTFVGIVRFIRDVLSE